MPPDLLHSVDSVGQFPHGLLTAYTMRRVVRGGIMIRLAVRWICLLWCVVCVIATGCFIVMRQSIHHDTMRVQIVGAHYLVDFATGITYHANPLPPTRAESMSPDGQYIVTVVGSPRGSYYRILNIATQDFVMIGPYRSPTSARTPAFWTDNDTVWLVTLSRDRRQTVLRQVNPANPEEVIIRQTFDFPAYYVRMSPDRRWLVLGSEAFRTEGVSHSVYEIAVANIETGDFANLGVADTVRVRWSRNGEWVVTQYRDDEFPNLPQVIRWYHIPSGRSFMTHAAAFEREVAWSGDGHFAAYRVQAPDESYEVYRLNLDTLENIRIFSSVETANLYWMDNVLLIESFTQPERTLYQLVGDDIRILTTLPQSSFMPLLISPDEQYLVYNMRGDGEHIIMRLHVASGIHEYVAVFETMPLSIDWE